MARIDTKASLTAGPHTYALVVGVSRYRHIEDGSAPTKQGSGYGLKQLTSAARSASLFAEWLLTKQRTPDAPLASAWVLLAPGPQEILAPEISPHVLQSDATLGEVVSAFKDFRKACEADPQNVAIIYVAGHGVQVTKEGATVLLEDFGNPNQGHSLEYAIDLVGCRKSMNHAAGCQTQVWFVDACRQRSSIAHQFERQGRGYYPQDELAGEVDASNILMATGTREAAHGRTNGESFFSTALLRGLAGTCAQGRTTDVDSWHVPLFELHGFIKREVNHMARAAGVIQRTTLGGGPVGDVVLHRCESPPKVELRVEVAPQDYRPIGSLMKGRGQVVLREYTAWPLEQSFEAGLYHLELNPAPGLEKYPRILNLEPPRWVEQVESSV